MSADQQRIAELEVENKRLLEANSIYQSTERADYGCTAKFDAVIEYLQRNFSEAKEHIAELEAKLERECLRLAGCGVAALGYFEECADEYKSASLDDVLMLRCKVTELEAEVERLNKQTELANESAIAYSHELAIAREAIKQVLPRYIELFEYASIHVGLGDAEDSLAVGLMREVLGPAVQHRSSGMRT